MKVLLLGRRSESTRAIHSALTERFGTVDVVLEATPTLRRRVFGRIKQFGLSRAIGQLMFRLLQSLLTAPQWPRRREIRRALSQRYPGRIGAFSRVDSVNSAAARRLLRQLRPDVVVVSGTRIIREKTLACAPVFVNMHAGITPQYRGVHGGYWAMANGDAANFGVTIHLVDSGVDTGAVLHHVRCIPTRRDGYSTYSLVQLMAGIPMLVRAVEAAATGVAVGQSFASLDGSKQWYHPTLGQYLEIGIRRGVW